MFRNQGCAKLSNARIRIGILRKTFDEGHVKVGKRKCERDAFLNGQIKQS